ncbi:OmpA family protein [Ferruginibacter sp. HRS2-29]|uniref:OmpA family protein n=1 Tax=Ferruginibacter sp. HRS2-29 TaxID=2487334 RepID=UPI0020CD36D4|nr:OmpA family protein [Ferruginibacter sp. HRS2-29]
MIKFLLPVFLCMTVMSKAQTNSSFDVHFDTDKFTLTMDATTSLDSFVKANPKGIKMKLYGHCDVMAGYEYNDVLSLKRTHAVKNYLVKKGVSPEAITEEKGFGKRRPLNRNRGENEMYLNRRVEIVTGDDELMEKEPLVKTLTQELDDTKNTVGKNIVLKNMNFYGGTHVIVPQSLPVLLELLDYMKKNPALEIAVEGHICCQEGEGDGLDIGTHTRDLSVNRAREICTYLNQNGIASSRLRFKGFGHQQPLTPYPEKTEEERTGNRRVEIKILRK